MCFHQFGPGAWPWALALWPGPGPHNICTLGGMGPGPGPMRSPGKTASPCILASRKKCIQKKSSKTQCVFTRVGLGPGPGPWPPGQALGLITFALWGDGTRAQGHPKSTQQLLPKSNKTLCVFTSFGLGHISGPRLPGPGRGTRAQDPPQSRRNNCFQK